MSRVRSLSHAIGVLVLLALPGIAAAQSTGGGSELGVGARLGLRFIAALVINLLLGGALLAIGPRYTSARVTDIHSDPGGTFAWGLGVGIGVPIVLAVLAITVIGLLVAIPGILVLAVVSLVGSAVTIVWVGTLLTGNKTDPGGKSVVVGALALAIPGAIPVLGNLIITVVSFVGVGAVGQSLYRSQRSNSRHDSRPGSRVH